VFDVLTIAALADELTETALDGRIQRVGHLNARTIAAEIYAGRRRRYLIASAESEQPCLFLSDTEPSFDTQLVTPLLLLLRKYVRGGFLVGVEQPPLERVLRLSIAKRLLPHNEPLAIQNDVADVTQDDDSDDEEAEHEDGLIDAVFVHVNVEIMGRHSNLILVDDAGRIMESVKRVTPAMSRVRPIQPRLIYTPPPPMNRPDPRRLTATEVPSLIRQRPASQPLHEVLTRGLRAISPQMAREIAFRVTGNAGVTVGDLSQDDEAALARETRALFEPMLTSAWAPRVYRDDESTVIAFAAVPMAHLADEFTEEIVESISRAAELSIGDVEQTPLRHGQRRERLVKAIASARDRVDSRLTALEVEALKAAEADQLRTWGESIYAYLWNIQPRQTSLDVDGQSIPLDPALSAKENAQAYFERYRKAQSAGSHLPDLVEKTETEIAYLNQLQTLAEQAERFDDLEAITVEFDAYQRSTGRSEASRKPVRRSTPPRRPRALPDPSGNAIYIGRSGAENDAVTFDIAGPNDTWLHARGVPGSHVIVRWRDTSGDEDDATVQRAAALAAYYSSSRSSGVVEVDVTRRRFVRKIKGAGPGMVTYRNERTLAVRPRDERDLGLDTRS
jgi:predicted ribosome quality control (RQC) complex YloA/Tae2 family protein